MSIMRCKQTFLAGVDGRTRRVRTGDLVAADDPIVKGRERYFESVEDHVAKRGASPVVERATAEPGEKRSVGRPRSPQKPAAAAADKPTPKPSPRPAKD